MTVLALVNTCVAVYDRLLCRCLSLMSRLITSEIRLLFLTVSSVFICPGDITSRLTSDTTTMSDALSLNFNVFVRSLIKASMLVHLSFGVLCKIVQLVVVGRNSTHLCLSSSFFLGMYRLSIRYPVSAGYLTIRYYPDPVK